MNVVIGLAGVKEAGKSTVSNIIRKYIPVSKEVAIADKLKNVSADVFGLERIQFDHQSLKELQFREPMYLTARKIFRIFEAFNLKEIPMDEINKTMNAVMEIPLNSPRKIAQVVGTELLREYGGLSVHCDNVEILDGGLTIISDVRFPNEYDYFKDNTEVNFIPLYIQRDEAEKHVDMEKSHPSETSVFKFNEKCVKIDNNGTLDETEARIVSILSDNNLL